MASRWRVWDGDAHVDSHGVPPRDDSEPVLPVDHNFDWSDVPELIKNIVIPEKLKKRIHSEEQHSEQQHVKTSPGATKYEMKGVKKREAPPTFSVRGRAEALKMKLGARVPKHSAPIQPQKDGTNSSLSQSIQVGNDDFVPDNQTLYFKHLPKNVTEKELEGSISQFGKVSVCKIYPEVDESIAYIRLEEASACNWVISYYRGMPYDDESVPLECDYVLPQLMI